MIHFTKSPKNDFAAYARGYAQAASHLAAEVLRDRYADYEAYPVVFLYRQALELHLKNVVLKAVHLASVRGQEVLEVVTYDHNLPRLFKTADAILRQGFPRDGKLGEFLDHLKGVVADFAELDESSFVFRYPVNKQGERPVEGAIHANIAAIENTMNNVLNALDTVDCGLDVHIDDAEEALGSYLHERLRELE